MSPNTSRWVLWLALVLVLPVPFYLVETGVVPAARIVLLAGVALAVIAAEGSGGAVGIAAALLGVQAIAYLALLWVAAHAASRLLGRLSPRRVAVVTLACVLLGTAVASSFEIYRTPFRTRSLHASLLQIFE